MRRMVTSTAVAAVLALYACGWSRPPRPLPLVGIAAAEREELAEDGVIGFEVAVARDGQIVLDEAFGYSDIEKRQRLSPRAMMPVGSVTKAVTAALVREALTRTGASPADRVRRFVHVSRNARGVSLAELLDQTSGLADYNTPDIRTALDPALQRTQGEPEQAIINFIDGQPRLEKGRFAYSNSNYFLLGLSAARGLGVPVGTAYERLFRENGIRASEVRYGYDRSPSADAGFAYDGFAYAWQPAEPSRWAGGAGALVATAAGVARLDGKIVTADVVRDLRAAAAARGSHYNWGWYAGMGPSCRLEFYHDGVNGAFRAFNLYDPESKVAVTAIGNTSSFDGWRIAHLLVRRYTAARICARSSPSASQLRSWITSVRLGDATEPFVTPEMAKAFDHGLAAFARLRMSSWGNLRTVSQRSTSVQDGRRIERFAAVFDARTIELDVSFSGSRIASLVFD